MTGPTPPTPAVPSRDDRSARRYVASLEQITYCCLGAILGFPVGMSAAADDPKGPPHGSAWSRRSATPRSSPARRCWASSAATSACCDALLVVSVILMPSAFAVPAARPPGVVAVEPPL